MRALQETAEKLSEATAAGWKLGSFSVSAADTEDGYGALAIHIFLGNQGRPHVFVFGAMLPLHEVPFNMHQAKCVKCDNINHRHASQPKISIKLVREKADGTGLLIPSPAVQEMRHL